MPVAARVTFSIEEADPDWPGHFRWFLTGRGFEITGDTFYCTERTARAAMARVADRLNLQVVDGRAHRAPKESTRA